MLAFYRQALRARKELPAEAAVVWLDVDRDDVLAIRRGDFVCVTVFDGPPISASPAWGEPVISGGTAGGTTTTTWYRAAPSA